MHASAPASAAVTYGSALALALGGLPFDPWLVVILPLGMLFGGMARAARMISERRTRADMRRELLVMTLASGALMTLAAKPVPGDDIAFDPVAEARYDAAIEAWGDRLRAAGVRLCRFEAELGVPVTCP